MSHSGLPGVQIVLSEGERAELVRRAWLPGRRKADRARIILACAEGTSNAEVARELGVAVKAGAMWRGEVRLRRPAGAGGGGQVGVQVAPQVRRPAAGRAGGCRADRAPEGRAGADRG